MKNLKLIFLIVVIIATANSCKKGDDDPFFSLQSRKKRLSTEWILTEGSQTTKVTTNNTTRTAETVFTKDSIKTSVSDMPPSSFKYSETLNFTEDGNFFILTEYPNYFDMGTMTSEISGKWEFLPSEGDYKNKERVKLLLEKETHTLAGNSSTVNYADIDYSVSYVLQLSRLSKDELNFSFSLTEKTSVTTVETIGSKKFIKK